MAVAAGIAAARRRAAEVAPGEAGGASAEAPTGAAPGQPLAVARPAAGPPPPAAGLPGVPGADGPAGPVPFAAVAPAPRSPERTESAADADRPPLPTRTPQGQAPMPADEPMPYEPPVFAVDDIAPLVDLARASWGTTSVVEAPHALPAPPVEPLGPSGPSGPSASSGLAGTNGAVRPTPPARALAAPTAASTTDAPPAFDVPPVDPPPAGPPSFGVPPAGGAPAGREPGGGRLNRRWVIVGGAAVAALAVVVGVAVAGEGGGDAAEVSATPTTAAPTTITAPATPQAVFQGAGAALTDAGSFAYSGTARILEVGVLRPSVWLGTDVAVTGEVDLRAERLHEVAVNPDGKATETVIDGGTVWGRTASSREGLADAAYAEIPEFANETPTPQGAQLLPAWLTQAAGPVPAPAAPRQPSYAGTLTAATLGDATGASPDAIVTVTVGPGGVPTHVDVVSVDAGQLALVYDITQVGGVAPIASPGDGAAGTAGTGPGPASSGSSTTTSDETTAPTAATTSTSAAPPSSPTTAPPSSPTTGQGRGRPR